MMYHTKVWDCCPSTLVSIPFSPGNVRMVTGENPIDRCGTAECGVMLEIYVLKTAACVGFWILIFGRFALKLKVFDFGL